MMGRRTAHLLPILAITCTVATAAAQQSPPGAQQPSANAPTGMSKIPTIELTDESAKNAVDAYLVLREKYGDKVNPANRPQTMTEGAVTAADINSVVTGKGFKDAEEWQKAIISVALAQGYLKKDNGKDMDQKIAELEANTQIPAAYKQQMLAMLKNMRPSANNLSVVKGLLADPVYGKKIADLGK